MLRTVIGVLASVLLVGSLGVAPAVAGHGGKKPPQTGHEGIPANADAFMPVPEGVCKWDASFSVDDQNGNGGISADEVNHNHYVFTSLKVVCDSTVNPQLKGAFTIRADGGTDGVVPTLGHGENQAIGWSHSSGYDDGSITERDSSAAASCDNTKSATNKGDIWVENNSNGKQASGWMKFVRVGLLVEVWGCLSTHDGKAEILFQGPLVLNPNPNQVGGKVKSFTVAGTVFMGFQ